MMTPTDIYSKRRHIKLLGGDTYNEKGSKAGGQKMKEILGTQNDEEVSEHGLDETDPVMDLKISDTQTYVNDRTF